MIIMLEAVTALFGVISAGIFLAHAVDGYRSRWPFAARPLVCKASPARESDQPKPPKPLPALSLTSEALASRARFN